MERYEAYKDSGIEWIGEIPAGWALARIKDGCRVVAGATPKSDVPEYWDGDVPWITPADYSGEQHYVSGGLRYITKEGLESCGTTLVPNGSVIVSNRAPIGLVSIAACELCTNQGCKAVVPSSDEVSAEYLYWYLLTQPETLNSFGRGTTFLELSTQALGAFVHPHPPIAEQRAIADYLDAKTAEIDALVTDCEREVELLREYRKAVISEAVTRGLDPNAPMRDSGVEWIGEIPADWEARRIKSFLKLRDERNNLPLEEVNLISLYTDLGVVQHSDLEKTTGNKAMTADGYKLVYKSDIVVNIILCWMGAIGMSNYSGVTSPAYDVYVPNEEVDPRYLHYLFRTSAFGGECYKAGRGIMAMRWRTYSDQFKAITVPLPPLQQQVAIANRLDDLSAQTEALIEAKQSMADKLREYRCSLISEAVTGKFKVPGV